jgi:hypothetical protein
MPKFDKKIFESFNDTIVLYYNMEALCNNFQDNTNWCQNDETVEDLEKSFSLGGAYVINESGKYYLLTRTESDYKIVDSKSSEVNLKNFTTNGTLEDFIETLTKPGPFFPIALRKYIYGRVDADYLDRFPKVSEVIERGSRKGETKIVFKLSENDYENMFNLVEDDIYIINAVTSSYGGYDGFQFVDEWSTRENFSEGYWYQSQYNDENKEKMKKIFSLLHPDWNEEDISIDNSSNEEVLAKLYRDFNKLVPGILGDMMDSANYYANEEVRVGVRESVYKELNNVFSKNGFSWDSRDNELTATVAVLYTWAVQLNMESATPKQLLEGIFNEVGGINGGWHEEYWNYQGDFDSHGFNVDLERNLDKILEKFEEDYQIEEWSRISKEIFSKFKQGYSLPFPNYPDLRLVVDSVNPETLKVEFKVQKGLQQRNFSMDYEKFNDFIYNKKLFNFENLLGF